MTLIMRDAAYADNIGADWKGPVAGYLNSSRALHPWPAADWRRWGRQPKLPIWVPEAGLAPGGEMDAFAVLRQLYLLGVPDGPAWLTVALDMETRHDPAYVDAFASVMRWAAFKTWVYGSSSTVFDNPRCNGYWVADYTGTPHLYPHSTVRATQYAANIEPGYDESELLPWVVDELWR